MPIYSVQGPDGRIYDIEGPEEASEAQVVAAAQQYYTEQQQAAQPQKLPEETGLYGAFRSAADLPVQFARGTVGAVQMIASAFGADNPVAQTLNSVNDVLEDLLSAGAKNDQAKIAQIMAEAEDQGVGANIKAALETIKTAPLDLVAQAFGSMAPIIAGSAASTVLGATVAGARAVSAGVGTVMGAGGVKGGIYDEVKNALVNNGFSEEDAEQRAEAAQSYASENLPQILAGGALGTIDAFTGAEAGIVRKFLTREIGEDAADTAARETIKKGATRRVTEGFAAEALPEAAQGAQQQLATNLALQNEGFDVPTMRGVAGAGALEGVIGGLTGAAVAVAPERAAPSPTAPPPPADVAPPPPPGAALPPGVAPPAGPPGTPPPPAGEFDLDIVERMEVPASAQPPVVVGGRESATQVRAAAEEAGMTTAKVAEAPPEITQFARELALKQAEDEKGTNRFRLKERLVKELRAKGATAAEIEKITPLRLAQQTLDSLSVENVVAPIKQGKFTTYRIKVPNVVQAGTSADQNGQVGDAVNQATGRKPDLSVQGSAAQEQKIEGVTPGRVAGVGVPAGQVDVGAGAGTNTVTAKPLVNRTRKQVVTEQPTETAEVAVITEPPKKRGRKPNIIAPIAEPVVAEGVVTPEAEYNSLLQRVQGAQVAATTQSQADTAALEQYLSTPLGQRGRAYESTANLLRNKALQSAKNIRELQTQLKSLVKEGTPGVLGSETVRVNIGQEVDLIAESLANAARSVDPTQQLRAQEKIALQRAQKRMSTEKENEAARAAAMREVRAREEMADTQKADEFAARVQFVQDKTGVTAKQEKVSKFKQELRDTREELVETLGTGDISTTLGILRDASILDGVKPQYRKAFDLVTKELQKLDFTQVNVVLENKADSEKTLPAGRDAQYDPATNTLLLSSAGAVNGATIQHELIHSATVKVIRDYQDAKARKELTPTQQQGVEHLMRIFDFVKKQKTTEGKPFSEYFSGAMESVYEFVAYGMTEPAFQKELAQLHSQNLRPQGKGGKNLWKQFMDAVASVLGIADKEGNVLAELSSTFRQILASPTDVILGVAPLSVRRQARVAVPPESMPPSDADALEESSRRKLEPKERKSFDFKEFMRYWFRSREGIERFIQRAANVNRPIQTLRRSMDLRGTLKMSGPDDNDAASYIDAAPSLIEMNIKYLQPTVDKLRGYIQELSQRTGRGYKDELARISTYFKAETVQQRRNVKYMRDVPLSTTRNIKLRNGKVISAADLRETIYSRVMKPEPISDTERNALYKTLETLVFADATAKTPSKYVDPLGYTTADLQASRKAEEKEQTYTVSDPRPTDFNDPVFDIIAGDQTTPRWSPDAVEQVLGRMRDDPNQELIQKIRDTVMEIDAETRKFNAQSGYLSMPAQNFIKFYKWDRYVPLKGKPDKNGELNTVSELDYTLYDNGPNFGAAYRLDYLPGFDGRGEEPDDPILMTIIDANRAATRAGRAGLMPAIANLVRQKRIPGKVYDNELITFEDRHNRAVNLDRFRASNLFFDYKENGDIVVIRIDDPRFIEALRPEYHGTEAVRRAIDRVTSTMASGHTRYNIKFAPYDFVRNVFFNAQALFKEYGPEFGAKYFMNVTRAVFMEGRMKATWRISTAFHTNKLSDLKRMAETDPFYAAAHEYLEKGGRVAYVQSYQSQKQLDGELSVLSKGKSTFDGAMEKARFWADRWADMFELVARVEAYRLAKDYNLNVREMSQNDAVQDAIYLTKNLTNFQRRGGSQASKWVNSMFMFMSPAMTGAVAAYDVLRDGAIFDLDKEFERESTDLKNKVTKAENALNRARKFVGTEEDKAEKIIKAQKDLDTVQAEYESEKQTFVKNLKPKIRNSRLLATTMMGTGAVIYLMALAVSEEDEYGRNAVTIDDKALWTRNARLPTTFLTGDKDSRPINLPWGFGPGALAAVGAQFAAYATGGAEFKDTFGNTVSIATDSFLPIPAARYNPLDNLGAWFITSLTPSAARPFVEMTLNVDSLGREIYRENYSRYGAVYSGTDNMQNAYKDFTAFLEKQTDGEVQLDPSIVRHLTSAYFDAIGSYVADGADLASLALGRREFNAKQDLLVIDSFIGAKTSYDAKKFAEIESDIKEKRQRYNAAMNSPHPNVFINYQINNAKDQFMVETYDQYVSEINDVRSEMKKIRSAPLQPKERDEMLKMLRFQRDMLMKNATERIDEIDKIF